MYIDQQTQYCVVTPSEESLCEPPMIDWFTSREEAEAFAREVAEQGMSCFLLAPQRSYTGKVEPDDDIPVHNNTACLPRVSGW